MLMFHSSKLHKKLNLPSKTLTVQNGSSITEGEIPDAWRLSLDLQINKLLNFNIKNLWLFYWIGWFWYMAFSLVQMPNINLWKRSRIRFDAVNGLVNKTPELQSSEKIYYRHSRWKLLSLNVNLCSIHLSS